MKFPSFKNELALLSQGYSYVSGCDEVGVAPLAGPVVAAACILDPASIGILRSKRKWYYRVRDSKTTYEKERDELAQKIRQHCLAYGIGEVQPEIIDRINIHKASLLAMKIAVEQMLAKLNFLASDKIFLFLDGRFTLKDFEPIECSFGQAAIVNGDESVLSISAASILAKVHRDSYLRQLDLQYPQYGFGMHKGYNTKRHRAALVEHGITPMHRKSFLKNYNFVRQKI